MDKVRVKQFDVHVAAAAAAEAAQRCQLVNRDKSYFGSGSDL